MGYLDLNSVQNPAVGVVPSVAWGDQIRDNFAALVQPPQVSCTTLTPIAAASGVMINCDLGTENYDSAGMHPAGANYYSVSTAGFYQLSTTVRWADSAYPGGNRYVEFYRFVGAVGVCAPE